MLLDGIIRPENVLKVLGNLKASAVFLGDGFLMDDSWLQTVYLLHLEGCVENAMRFVKNGGLE